MCKLQRNKCVSPGKESIDKYFKNIVCKNKMVLLQKNVGASLLTNKVHNNP